MAQEHVSESDVKELQKRIQSFNEELIPILGKYNLGIGAIAFLLPDGRIAAKPQLFDDRKKPVDDDETSIIKE